MSPFLRSFCMLFVYGICLYVVCLQHTTCWVDFFFKYVFFHSQSCTPGSKKKKKSFCMIVLYVTFMLYCMLHVYVYPWCARILYIMLLFLYHPRLVKRFIDTGSGHIPFFLLFLRGVFGLGIALFFFFVQ